MASGISIPQLTTSRPPQPGNNTQQACMHTHAHSHRHSRSKNTLSYAHHHTPIHRHRLIYTLTEGHTHHPAHSYTHSSYRHTLTQGTHTVIHDSTLAHLHPHHLCSSHTHSWAHITPGDTHTHTHTNCDIYPPTKRCTNPCCHIHPHHHTLTPSITHPNLLYYAYYTRHHTPHTAGSVTFTLSFPKLNTGHTQIKTIYSIYLIYSNQYLLVTISRMNLYLYVIHINSYLHSLFLDLP